MHSCIQIFVLMIIRLVLPQYAGLMILPAKVIELIAKKCNAVFIVSIYRWSMGNVYFGTFAFRSLPNS